MRHTTSHDIKRKKINTRHPPGGESHDIPWWEEEEKHKASPRRRATRHLMVGRERE